MKVASLFLCMFLTSQVFAQGKFAGSLKTMISKTYKDSRKMPGMKDWQFREGTVITPMNDPEMITVDVYQQGTTYAVIFSLMEDTAVTA